VLSAQTPAIAGKGELHSWAVHSEEPGHPALYFDREGELASGGLMFWLHGLDTCGRYVVELHLSVLEGAIEIGTSTGPCIISAAQGLDHRVRLVLDSPCFGAALLTLRPVAVRDWAFYELRVRALPSPE
jgi:hypothetical protein